MSNQPPVCICTPGVMWMNSGLVLIFDPQINPSTKSECSSAICTFKGTTPDKHLLTGNLQWYLKKFAWHVLTTAFVYSPVASDPLELIWAMSKQPRPRGFPTALRPFTTPGPGTAWAFTMWDHDEILYKPPGKWIQLHILRKHSLSWISCIKISAEFSHLHTGAWLCSLCQQTYDPQRWGSCASQPKPAVSGWRSPNSPVSRDNVRSADLKVFSKRMDCFHTNLQDVCMCLQHADARAQTVSQLKKLLAARHVGRHTEVGLLLLHDHQQPRGQRMNVCREEDGETTWRASEYSTHHYVRKYFSGALMTIPSFSVLKTKIQINIVTMGRLWLRW